MPRAVEKRQGYDIANDIRMVGGATSERLDKWELRLCRHTYANHRELVNALLDTSLYRSGAPVRRTAAGGYYEEGGVAGGSAVGTVAAGSATDAGLLQAVNRVEDAVRALPGRQYIGWSQDDTAELEQRLDERAADRGVAAIR